MNTGMQFREKVSQYITAHSLFQKEDKLLVALSGGADSVALLRVLHAGGWSLQAAHCNFHLRGEESDRDEEFVRSLCQELGIVLHVTHFDTRDWAVRKRLSIEMAARELRYAWFEQLCIEHALQHVAVAHHQDDSVETCLLNLIRGTGIDGLRGIRPKNGRVVRPLLGVNRNEVLAYLDVLKQPYVTDSTNLTDEYTRNKIRLTLLPLLEEINPSVRKSISAMTDHLSDVAGVYETAMQQAVQRVTVADGSEVLIDRLLEEIAPKAILFKIFHPLGFTASQLDAIHCSLSGESGKRFFSRDWEVLKDRNRLLIRSRERTSSIQSIEKNAPIVSTLQNLSEETTCMDVATGKLCFRVRAFTGEFEIRKNKNVASLDADNITLPLLVRHVQIGDAFVPFGMRGRKLVSDYLTDRKVTRFKKEQQLVVCDGSGRIVWLVGERSDNRYRLIPGESRRVLEIEWIENKK